MKKNIFLLLTLLSIHWFTHSSFQLTNQTLKAADSLGLFDRALVDILQVRQKIKELVIGKFIWRGASLLLDVFATNNNKKLDHQLHLIVKRPEALFGATFVIISPQHPHLFQFVSANQQEAMLDFITKLQSRTLLDRYENPDSTLISTGTFVYHPITKEKLPIFVSDYILEEYDARITHAHLAIPGHDCKDFAVAQHNHLPIKQVITSPEEGKTSSPQINKTTKQLTAAYPGQYSDCFIINSDFLNGSMRNATKAAITFLQEQKLGTEYAEPILYHFSNKTCNINDLQAIETIFAQENKTLSVAQKEHLLIIMIQAQSDLLSIVEQFLINARDVKELMIELIEESCKLRNNNTAYLLHWSHLNSNETEKVIFKRDINTFVKFYKFCAELIDFLGDFGSSCTHALENLKKIKNNK